MEQYWILVAIVAMLFGLSLPAARVLIGSFESQAGTKAMIEAAFASARAIAAKEQRYAGVRFQKAYHPDGPTKAEQYMIFIVNEEPQKMGGLVRRTGFRAVEGVAPIKLPGSLGVLDLMINGNYELAADSDFDNNHVALRDTSAFSVVFSPSGKLAIHYVRVRNRDGDYRPMNLNNSRDEIFNSPENIVSNDTGMFVQDDYPLLGLEEESSRNSFLIYDRAKFNEVYRRGRAWSGYLVDLAGSRFYINPYTGRIIDK